MHAVLRVGRSGFLYTLLGIGFALGLAWRSAGSSASESRPAFLIATGTAICGGSAIAAIGPLVEASDEEMAVSLGTVFVLNAIALLAFPPIGAALGLTQTQFGLWAALAIHDTSSVVGAARGTAPRRSDRDDRQARARPLDFAARGRDGGGAAGHGRARRASQDSVPWFVGLFVLAAVCNTYVPAGAALYPWIVRTARVGLTVTLST